MLSIQDYNEYKLIRWDYNYCIFENGIYFNPKKQTILIPKEQKPQKEQNKDKNVYENVNQPSGLINKGHSCYINAILQCLINCVPLTKYFLTKYVSDNCNIFSNQYQEFIKKYQKKDVYAAQNIVNYFCSSDSSIKYAGSDSKDFLFEFCDKIQSELKNSEMSIVIDASTNPEDFKSVIKERIKLDKADCSIIYECFNFWIGNGQSCCNLHCKKYKKAMYELRSESYFMFYLSEIYNKKVYYSGKRKGQYNKLTLNDCFHYYLLEEVNCAYCQNNIEIKNKIYKLPNILIIVLNRGKNNLFNVSIDFNEELYLNEYYQKLKINHNISGTEYEKCPKYNLLCGTILLKDYYNPGKGHTIAFVRDYHGKYNVYDDIKINNNIDFQSIKNKDVYILFYQIDKNHQ